MSVFVAPIEGAANRIIFLQNPIFPPTRFSLPIFLTLSLSVSIPIICIFVVGGLLNILLLFVHYLVFGFKIRYVEAELGCFNFLVKCFWCVVYYCRYFSILIITNLIHPEK